MDIIDRILKAIDDRNKKKTTPIDRIGTVKRIDGNTAWVHLDNGVDVTPVAKTINCEKGDTVRVRMSSGNAYILGNDTRPPTDDAEALVAKAVAKLADKTAIKAQDTADVAQATAENAKDTAETAATTANEAKTIADNTEQHFWFEGTGNDTGAHIAEITKDEWDVTPSGGNLLARSNGIAVRDGTTELASFGSTAIELGKNSTTSIIKMCNSKGYISVSDYIMGAQADAVVIGNSGTSAYKQVVITSQTLDELQAATSSLPTTYNMSTVAVAKDGTGLNSFGYSGKKAALLQVVGSSQYVSFAVGTYSGNAVTASSAATLTTSGFDVSKKLTAGAIDESLFSVSTESLTISASSTGAYADDTPISKSGYYPLAVAGVSITSGGAQSRGFYLGNRTTGSATLYGRIQATTSGSKSCTVYVLWVKNTVS